MKETVIKVNRNNQAKQCPFCEKQYYTPKHLKGHIKSKHPDMLSHFKPTKDVTTKCPLATQDGLRRPCGKEITEFAMLRHVQVTNVIFNYH